jgi:hypothetical protein
MPGYSMKSGLSAVFLEYVPLSGHDIQVSAYGLGYGIAQLECLSWNVAKST